MEHRVDVVVFDEPSGNVRGFANLFADGLSSSRKEKRIAHVTFVVDEKALIVTSFPSKCMPAELRYLSEVAVPDFLGVVSRVSETKAGTDDADEMPQEADGDEDASEPYCMECGGETLSYVRTVANGTEWKCKTCGHVFLW